MPRAPKDYNQVIREREEKLAAAQARHKAAIKGTARQNDAQNARLLRASSVHQLPPDVRMGCFLEMEELAKEQRNVKRWEARGREFFRGKARAPRLVEDRGEPATGTHAEPAAA